MGRLSLPVPSLFFPCPSTFGHELMQKAGFQMFLLNLICLRSIESNASVYSINCRSDSLLALRNKARQSNQGKLETRRRFATVCVATHPPQSGCKQRYGDTWVGAAAQHCLGTRDRMLWRKALCLWWGKKRYIYSKDLVQPHAGPVLAASASMNSLELSQFFVERSSLSYAVYCQFFCDNNNNKKKTSIEEAQLETVPTDWTAVCFVVVSTPRSNHDHLEVSHKMELISSQNLAKHSSPQPSFSLVG